MKRKELFWMLVPCLLFASAGVYFTKKPAPVFPKKLHLEVETKLVPATPRDVARGFDTVVLIQTKLTGPKAIDFTQKSPVYVVKSEEESITDAQHRTIQVPLRGDFSTEDSTRHLLSQQMIHLIKLADVPMKTGDLYFHLVENRMLYQSTPSRVLERTNNPPRNFLVRRAGQIIKPPVVKKYRPFKLIGIESGPWPVPGFCNYQLKIHIQRFEPLQHLPGRGQVSIDNSQIIADGKTIADSSGESYSPTRNPLEITKNLTIPPKCRDAKFKGLLSINDCWPLPIEVELRKNGKDLVRPRPILPAIQSTP